MNNKTRLVKHKLDFYVEIPMIKFKTEVSLNFYAEGSIPYAVKTCFSTFFSLHMSC